VTANEESVVPLFRTLIAYELEADDAFKPVMKFR
jgi:hypothetical protein